MLAYPCKFYRHQAGMKTGTCDINYACHFAPFDNCPDYVPNAEFPPMIPMNIPMAYHQFCYTHGITRACFEFDDGTAVDYVNLGEKEFQLSRVGDMPTNYVLP